MKQVSNTRHCNGFKGFTRFLKVEKQVERGRAMIKEEAIKVLEQMKDGFIAVYNGNPVMYGFSDYGVQAFDMAIEALKNERPKGYWILSQSQDKEDTDNGNYRFECSNCGYSDTHSKATEVPYCWHCGASMKGMKQDD